jgi:hypothetical protein
MTLIITILSKKNSEKEAFFSPWLEQRARPMLWLEELEVGWHWSFSPLSLPWLNPFPCLGDKTHFSCIPIFELPGSCLSLQNTQWVHPSLLPASPLHHCSHISVLWCQEQIRQRLQAGVLTSTSFTPLWWLKNAFGLGVIILGGCSLESTHVSLSFLAKLQNRGFQ